MKFRKTMGTLTMVATTALVSVATATPAAAGSWDHIWTSTDDNPGATIKIQEYGDITQLCDSDADGRYAMADIEWYHNGTWHGYYLMASGDGNCTTRDYQDHNIPEGVRVYVTVGINNKYDLDDIDFAENKWYVNDH